MSFTMLKLVEFVESLCLDLGECEIAKFFRIEILDFHSF